jgi:hypothetical protein
MSDRPINPPSRPDRQSGEPWSAELLAAEFAWIQYLDDSWDDAVHKRLVALEEALISRKARRRLRREIRQSADTFAWAGPDFYGRRVEAAFNAFMCDKDERERHAA